MLSLYVKTNLWGVILGTAAGVLTVLYSLLYSAIYYFTSFCIINNIYEIYMNTINPIKTEL